MPKMDRNLESSILLDESYLKFTRTIKTSADKINRNAGEASEFLLDEPSRKTIELIRQLCININHLVDNSQEIVIAHLKKAQKTLDEYKTIL